MHAKRLGVGVVVVNRLLYAVGGFNGTERLASVECYHPENNAWSFVPSMTCGRSGAGVAAINQYIYVVGGFDGTRQLSSVERYDTENQIWEHIAPIKIARSALSLTSLDGKLYAIGGFDGTNFLSIVEVYDPKTNTWEQGTPLSSGRSGHASAVIYQPSCVNNFMDCIEEEGPNRDGSGSGNNDNRSDDSSIDQPGSSRTDRTAGGNTSHVNFHTSFGSSGCRNCENEFVSNLSNIRKEDNKLLLSDERNVESTSSIPDNLYKKRRIPWCKKQCKLKTRVKNGSDKLNATNFSYIPQLFSPAENNDFVKNATNNFDNTNPNITNGNSTFSSLNPKKKCFQHFKSKCIISVIRNCNARNYINEYLNYVLEKHFKKFVVL